MGSNHLNDLVNIKKIRNICIIEKVKFMEDIAAFIKKIENEFEELEKGALTPETNYREIEDWSSMHALIIIALIDSEYDVLLKGEDLQQTSTIQDLFNIVKIKINNG